MIYCHQQTSCKKQKCSFLQTKLNSNFAGFYRGFWVLLFHPHFHTKSPCLLIFGDSKLKARTFWGLNSVFQQHGKVSQTASRSLWRWHAPLIPCLRGSGWRDPAHAKGGSIETCQEKNKVKFKCEFDCLPEYHSGQERTSKRVRCTDRLAVIKGSIFSFVRPWRVSVADFLCLPCCW